MAVLEALQVGAPIVASAVDGIPEDLTDGSEALLVPPGDQCALASAIAQLLGNPLLRARLGARARELYERRFSAQVTAAALASLYTEFGLFPAPVSNTVWPVVRHSPSRSISR